MELIKFEWDEKKNKNTQKKRNISFEEAKTVFWDENARQYYDPDHSEDEDRYLMLGMDLKLRILVVSHTIDEDETIIRIISARKATLKEIKEYKRYYDAK